MKDLRIALGLSKAVLAHAAAGRNTHDVRIAQWLGVPLTWIQNGGDPPWPATTVRDQGDAYDDAPAWATRLMRDIRALRDDVTYLRTHCCDDADKAAAEIAARMKDIPDDDQHR